MQQGFRSYTRQQRARAGALAYHAGQCAEEQAAAHYLENGAEVLARRWRGKWGGEVDLIAREGECIVFVEVKKAVTHTFAAERLSRRQMDRICASACEYAEIYAAGSLTQMRFDVALVDDFGRLNVIENAFGAN